MALLGTIGEDHPLLDLLSGAASPDDALLAMTRLATVPEPYLDAVRTMLTEPGTTRDRLVAVLGASSALADHLVRHPEDLSALGEPSPIGADTVAVRAEMLAAVGADPDAPAPVAGLGGGAGVDAMRLAYRRRLLTIAAADLVGPEPLSLLPAVGSALADLAAGALEAGLAVARADLPDHGLGARIAVVGMGKTGGRELNYVSDVDVIYVAEPAEGVDEGEALAVATRLAAGHDPGVLRAVRGARAVAGGRRVAPGGQAGSAGPDRGEPPGLLRALGQDLGVPGPAQGTGGGGGPRGGPRLQRSDLTVGVARRRAGELRRGLPGDAASRRGARPAVGSRPPGQARQGRAARRRVHRPAAPAGARPRGRVDPQPAHPVRAAGAVRRRLRRA